MKVEKVVGELREADDPLLIAKPMRHELLIEAADLLEAQQRVIKEYAMRDNAPLGTFGPAANNLSEALAQLAKLETK